MQIPGIEDKELTVLAVQLLAADLTRGERRYFSGLGGLEIDRTRLANDLYECYQAAKQARIGKSPLSQPRPVPATRPHRDDSPRDDSPANTTHPGVSPNHHP